MEEDTPKAIIIKEKVLMLIQNLFLGEKVVAVINPVLTMEKNHIKKIIIINIKEIELMQIMMEKNIKIIIIIKIMEVIIIIIKI